MDTCGGDCCRAFTLSVPWETLVADSVNADLGEHYYRQSSYAVALFQPLGEHTVNPISGMVYDSPRELFTCAALGEDGLCTIYDNRLTLCHNYPHGRCKQPGCRCEVYTQTPLEMEC